MNPSLRSISAVTVVLISLAALAWVRHRALAPLPHPTVSVDRQRAQPLASYIKQDRSPASSLAQARAWDVTIDEGEVAYLDESTNLGTLTINGTLICDEDRAPDEVELRVRTLIVNGVFQCGTSDRPYRKKIVISLKHADDRLPPNHAYRGLIVNNGGKWIVHGDPSPAGWTRLSRNANPGDESITVEAPQSFSTLAPATQALARTAEAAQEERIRAQLDLGPTWKVGDRVAIGPTGFDSNQAESFQIIAIDEKNPNKLFLDAPIQYFHWGQQKDEFLTQSMGRVVLDERAEVANLSRNIQIRADELDQPVDESDTANGQLGGHIMVHPGGQAWVSAVELYKLGQAGFLARYPFHWHWVGDAPGQYFKNSSIHHSFNRCVVVHRTNRTRVFNNVCFNFKGHGYFLEDGVEINNRLIQNLAIQAKAPSPSKILLASDNIATTERQGRFPSVSAFWISHPQNVVMNNVVAGSVGTGFWMSFESEVKSYSGAILARPLTSSTLAFSYNTAHSSRVGITWDGAPNGPSTGNPNNPNDRALVSAHYAPPLTPTFTGLRAYKNDLTGIYFRGQTAVFKNSVTADNGWSFWVSYNQIVRDSVIIAQTSNHSDALKREFFQKTLDSRYRKTGNVLYDGPFEMHGVDFINFSTYPEYYFFSNTGKTVNATRVPFTATGGSNKFTNFTSKLRFDPEPVHRIHIEDATVKPSTKNLLGNGVLRDLDGTLTSMLGGGTLVSAASMGITPSSQCSSGQQKFYNFNVCSSLHTEGSLTFMRWDSPYASPWATPFLARRSDGTVNYPPSDWPSLSGTPNNLFAIANSEDLQYQILPLFSYETDRNLGVTVRLDANTEIFPAKIPIVQIVAYGNNCRLEEGAQAASSLEDLRTKTVTSYYSSGPDFYVKIVPVDRWMMIVPGPQVRATAHATNIRFSVRCDNSPLRRVVKGRLQKVVRGPQSTLLTGWACNSTVANTIRVRIYAKRRALAVQPGGRNHTGWGTPVFLTEGIANKNFQLQHAFDCGKIATTGRAFTISIPNSILSAYTHHVFEAKGVSASTSEPDQLLDGSGEFPVMPEGQPTSIQNTE